MFRFYLRILPVLILFGMNSCSTNDQDKHKEKPPPYSFPNRATKELSPIDMSSLYRAFPLTGALSLSDLSHELGTKKMLLIYKINRRDLKHLKQGDTIAIPNLGDSELSYAPYPLHIGSLDSVKKILIVSRRIQAFGAYEHGKLTKWGPTSTGKKSTPTPAGLYHTNWKSKETHSTVDEAWVLKWYFNLDNLEGISLHQYDLPGYPVSHSCVRLLDEDACWIYNWAEQWKLSPDRKTISENGTPVVVFDEYRYGMTPPWKKLLKNPNATSLSEEEVASQVMKYLGSGTMTTGSKLK